MGKWRIPGAGKIQDDPRTLCKPENKEVLQKMGTCQKEKGTNLKELPKTKAGTAEAIK